MEASALPTRITRGRAPLSAALLRVRSDEQLVALFRAGSDDAFRAIHDRYRTRLLAYARQMLRGAGGDPEDAMQDVFLRAYRSLRGSDRPVTLRAWLYRIAHNRCIDELRRPGPVPTELDAEAESAFGAPRANGEPPAVLERGAALERLIADVQTLPQQQRSALLMRELQGLTYEELASALGVSVPAIKSLLLRARTGLLDIKVARDAPCEEIRDELMSAADRSVRISGRARRHCSECETCSAYRRELRRVRRSFAALTPGPLAQLGVLLGIGGGGGAAAAGAGGGAAAVSGSAAAVGGGAFAGATAAKIAVTVCCAALIGTAGGAVIVVGSKPHHQPAATAPLAHTARLSGLPATTVHTIVVPPAAGDATAGAKTATHHSVTPGGSGLPPIQPAILTPSGATGTTGATGATGSGLGGGAVAVTGATAATGASGATGATAATGSSGATDATGVSGATGDTGTTGTTGATAPQGATGASAATGQSGASSASGATAPTGTTGTAGASNPPAQTGGALAPTVPGSY